MIISRARTLGSKEKHVLAGETRAVNPQLIGGRRMASFALHADVAEFLDEVMHDDDLNVRIEQVRLGESGGWVGRTVVEVDVHGAAAGSCSSCADRARARSCRRRRQRRCSSRAARSSSSARPSRSNAWTGPPWWAR